MGAQCRLRRPSDALAPPGVSTASRALSGLFAGPLSAAFGRATGRPAAAGGRGSVGAARRAGGEEEEDMLRHVVSGAIARTLAQARLAASAHARPSAPRASRPAAST